MAELVRRSRDVRIEERVERDWAPSVGVAVYAGSHVREVMQWWGRRGAMCTPVFPAMPSTETSSDLRALTVPYS